MLNIPKILILFTFFAFCMTFVSCEKDNVNESQFTVADEILLGEVLRDAVNEEGNEYLVLSSSEYSYANSFVNTSFNNLIPSDVLTTSGNFKWQVYILQNDSVANAFTLPGGYIYITTGLLKNHISSKAEMMGLIGHEMAIADKRESVKKLKNEFSESLLLDVALGSNKDAALDLVQVIAEFPYKLEAVKASDEFALRLICPTTYSTDSYVDFLDEEMNREDKSLWAETHPISPNRFETIDNLNIELACDGNSLGDSLYEDFVMELP